MAKLKRLDLPSECPLQPQEVLPKEFGRWVYSENVGLSDFVDWLDEPHNRDKFDLNEECIQKSMSIFELSDKKISSMLKIGRIRDCYYGYAVLLLTNEHGIVSKTRGSGHYSWWLLAGIDPTSTVQKVVAK